MSAQSSFTAHWYQSNYDERAYRSLFVDALTLTSEPLERSRGYRYHFHVKVDTFLNKLDASENQVNVSEIKTSFMHIIRETLQDDFIIFVQGKLCTTFFKFFWLTCLSVQFGVKTVYTHATAWSDCRAAQPLINVPRHAHSTARFAEYSTPKSRRMKCMCSVGRRGQATRKVDIYTRSQCRRKHQLRLGRLVGQISKNQKAGTMFILLNAIKQKVHLQQRVGQYWHIKSDVLFFRKVFNMRSNLFSLKSG